MQELEQLIIEHRNLLLKFRETSIDLQQIDPDEENELFGQIIDFRNKLLDLMEPVFQKIVQKKSTVSLSEYQNLISENRALSKEISELDACNEERLHNLKKNIAGELKQVATNSRAFTAYQSPQFVSGKTIDHL